jgi:hypothetical protein
MLVWITWALIVSLIALAAVAFAYTVGHKYPIIPIEPPEPPVPPTPETTPVWELVLVPLFNPPTLPPATGTVVFEFLPTEPPTRNFFFNPIDFYGVNRTAFLEAFQIGGQFSFKNTSDDITLNVSSVDNQLPSYYTVVNNQVVSPTTGTGTENPPNVEVYYI